MSRTRSMLLALVLASGCIADLETETEPDETECVEEGKPCDPDTSVCCDERLSCFWSAAVPGTCREHE